MRMKWSQEAILFTMAPIEERKADYRKYIVANNGTVWQRVALFGIRYV